MPKPELDAAGEGAPVLARRAGAIVTLVLNRPDQRNALDPELAGSLADAVDAAAGDPAVRVIVVTGAGRAFCAGAKLDALLTASERGDVGGVSAAFGVVERVYRALLTARPPIIAAVNGPALAGGAGIATVCDLVVAAEDATFGYPEVALGLTPGMVLTFLVQQVGVRAALDLALTGRRISAAEALRIGLITEVVPSDELMTRVESLARHLAGLSPEALAATKRWAWTLAESGRAIEQGRDLSTLLALTDGARAGMRAFFDGVARRQVDRRS